MGCSQPCEKIPALLEDPTENEELLWHFATRPCIEFDDPCRVPPLLDNATGCEAALLAYLKEFSGCRLFNGCSGIPSFAPELNCPPNLTKMIEFVERIRTPEGGETGGGVAECGDTGFPLSISTFTPGLGGPFAQGEVDCSASKPEIRLTAAGGVAPYSWIIENVPDGCEFCDIGGAGLFSGCAFGPPFADGVCDSRFVITAPFNNPLIPGFAYNKAGFLSRCTHSPGFAHSGTPRHCNFKCNDVPDSFCPSSVSGIPNVVNIFQAGPLLCPTGENCFDHFGHCSTRFLFQCILRPPFETIDCNRITFLDDFNDAIEESGVINDLRTQTMKDNGCCPCILAFNGLVVTVTDAIGTMVSITLIAEA